MVVFRQILDKELFDDKFYEYLENSLDDNVVDDLQIEIQILIGEVVPKLCTQTPITANNS